MLKNLCIEKFKCFEEVRIEFKKGTLLLGVNSGGKSTTIQSILLMSMALEEERINFLDNKYNLKLNSFDEVINQESSGNFQIKLTNESNFETVLEFKPTEYTHIVEVSKNENAVSGNCPNIIYLPANRGLAKTQIAGDSMTWSIGENGEHLAFIIESSLKPHKPIFYKERNLFGKEGTKLLDIQLEDWLDYILPGNSVSALDLKYGQYYGLQFRNKNGTLVNQENIGFGVSFILPILVSALTISEGEILIIENPEIHLHPRAQSNLAVFLAVIASSGVQVIVETHSDHIVNGFRKATMYQERSLKNEDLLINYFEKHNVIPIELNNNAELEVWPNGFMDQFEDDLYEIRMMRLKND